MRDLYEIAKDMEKIYTQSWKPEGIILKEGTVIDEEKSVKWNREEVDRRNKEYKEKEESLKKAKREKKNALDEEILDIVVATLGCDKKQAKLIYDKAYSDGHAYGAAEVMNKLDELMEFIEEYNKLAK